MSYLVFISHHNSDIHLANLIRQRLVGLQIDVFVAKFSLQPGSKWSSEIHHKLNRTDLVLFLASRKAIKSQYVQQEVGGALFGKKFIVPVIWEINPNELPGWINELHALDLRNFGSNWLKVTTQWIDSLRAKKAKATFLNNVAFGVIAGLLIWYGSQKDK